MFVKNIKKNKNEKLLYSIVVNVLKIVYFSIIKQNTLTKYVCLCVVRALIVNEE